jgi:5-methylcytosine-specific restriction enzyme A
MTSISFDWDDDDIRRERQKARDLRKSQWWKRKLSKGICHYCQAATSSKELTMDHVIPLARGGRTTKGNVIPCCKACNNKKKIMLPMDWQAYLDGLGTAEDE